MVPDMRHNPIPRFALASLLVALVVAISTPALAQSKADIKAAKQAYSRGEKAFADGRYEESLVEFEKGYGLSQKELFLLNIAYAHEKLGHLEAAIDYYERYLATGLEAEERAEVEARVAEVKAAMPPPTPPPPPIVAVPEKEENPLLAQKAVEPKAEPASVPLTERWEFWAGVGAVVVLGIVIGVAASSGPEFQSRGSWGARQL
jgi:tetratricopeptide (TPR) repeat protein